jgi:hypothetical protein
MPATLPACRQVTPTTHALTTRSVSRRLPMSGCGPRTTAPRSATKPALPGPQPLHDRRFQQLQLRVVVDPADVLDIPRPAMNDQTICIALALDAVFTVSA